MKIPDGYTQEEVLQIIQEISRNLARKLKFDIYAEEDLQQEAFLLALPALELYDGRAPLRNFLSVVLRTRLLNFKRNTMSASEEKHRILGAASLETDPASSASPALSRLIDAELREFLNRNIPPELRPDFLRLCDGYGLSHHRKKLILETIRELLSEYGDDI